MNSKKFLYISGALLGVTLTGATIMYGISNYKALDELDFDIVGAKVSGNSKTGKLTLNVQIKLKNPTDFKLKIYGYDFAVTLGGVYLGEVSTSTMFEVRKNGYTIMTIPFSIAKQDFTLDHITELVNLITKVVSKQKVKALITGSVKVGFNRVIKTNLDFNDYEVYALNGDTTEEAKQDEVGDLEQDDNKETK